MGQLGSGGPNPCGDSVKKMSTHFLNLINRMDLEQLGSGGPKNPSVNKVKKMSTHFLSLG